MAIGSEDQSVLNHIDKLVKEEERLYGQTELADRERPHITPRKRRSDDQSVGLV
jgi:hypothetical protein